MIFSMPSDPAGIQVGGSRHVASHRGRVAPSVLTGLSIKISTRVCGSATTCRAT